MLIPILRYYAVCVRKNAVVSSYNWEKNKVGCISLSADLAEDGQPALAARPIEFALYQPVLFGSRRPSEGG